MRLLLRKAFILITLVLLQRVRPDPKAAQFSEAGGGISRSGDTGGRGASIVSRA